MRRAPHRASGPVLVPMLLACRLYCAAFLATSVFVA